MVAKKILAISALVAMGVLNACTGISQETAEFDGIKRHYVLGRVSNACYEAVFRDAYDPKGNLVASSFVGGAGLTCAAFNGAVAGASMGAGIALQKPASFKSSETNSFNNEQGQGQGQQQGQQQGQSSKNTNTNVNSNTATGGSGGSGGSGGQGGHGGHGNNGFGNGGGDGSPNGHPDGNQ